MSLGEAGLAPRFTEAVEKKSLPRKRRNLSGHSLRAAGGGKGRALHAARRHRRFRPREGKKGLESAGRRRPRARDPAGCRAVPRALGGRGRQRLGRPAAGARHGCPCREKQPGEFSKSREKATCSTTSCSPPGVISSIYVSGLAHARRGAWPLGVPGLYGADDLHVSQYAKAAKTHDGFLRYLTNGSIRQGRAPRLRNREVVAGRAPCGDRRLVSHSGQPAPSFTSKATRNFRVSLQQRRASNPFTEGSRELFDPRRPGAHRRVLPWRRADRRRGARSTWCARRGKRFPGSFGSAYMYGVVRPDDPASRGALAPHAGAKGRVRLGARLAGGTNHRQGAVSRGRRKSTVSASKACIRGAAREEVREHTGFAYDVAPDCGETVPPSPQDIEILRTEVRSRIAENYPEFAARVWGRG